jgi:hypothetical protein
VQLIDTHPLQHRQQPQALSPSSSGAGSGRRPSRRPPASAYHVVAFAMLLGPDLDPEHGVLFRRGGSLLPTARPVTPWPVSLRPVGGERVVTRRCVRFGPPWTVGGGAACRIPRGAPPVATAATALRANPGRKAASRRGSRTYVPRNAPRIGLSGVVLAPAAPHPGRRSRASPGRPSAPWGYQAAMGGVRSRPSAPHGHAGALAGQFPPSRPPLDSMVAKTDGVRLTYKNLIA